MTGKRASMKFFFLCQRKHGPEVEDQFRFPVGCRVFVRADVDTVILICAEVHKDALRHNRYPEEPAANNIIFWKIEKPGSFPNFRFNVEENLPEIRVLLGVKGIRVPRVIVMNGTTLGPPACSSLVTSCNDPSEEFECHMLTDFLSVCEELLLINYTASEAIVGSSLKILFIYINFHVPPLMKRERLLLRRVFEVDAPTAVVVPFMRFRSTETAAEQCRRFLSTANDNCPAITHRVFQKVSAIYARWVRMLSYPEQWTRVHIFLKMFNSLNLTDNPQRWDSVDPRQLDISALSKMTFEALDGCFEDEEDKTICCLL
ncbi:uncharacterized protein LOC129591108 [Paramacrobiotus metropolitanus]|uniref:uncharacterized protein LOC129591108 n=1 Tax=Paramacrobiotus metropolitanus TaxID=2943436 RepID=UPI002445DCCA|nr:uncharacterized protein LOC129591108 [Paramacrobiotus metropolitanus]XP_055342615.1 uncharacterized protein LOC129591108 [Paramacrobiotus metropolitanus]